MVDQLDGLYADGTTKAEDFDNTIGEQIDYLLLKLLVMAYLVDPAFSSAARSDAQGGVFQFCRCEFAGTLRSFWQDTIRCRFIRGFLPEGESFLANSIGFS